MGMRLPHLHLLLLLRLLQRENKSQGVSMVPSSMSVKRAAVFLTRPVERVLQTRLRRSKVLYPSDPKRILQARMWWPSILFAWNTEGEM